MRFSDIHLDTKIIKHLETLSFLDCTEVQSKVISKILSNANIMVQSQTGTGKTAAFLIPLIHKYITNTFMYTHSGESKESPVKALIISPTWELSMQIIDDFNLLGGKQFSIPSVLLCGGRNFREQENALKTSKIIVATPGRLLDFCGKNKKILSQVEYFVLDEADRLFDMGFYPSLIDIISFLPSQERRQNLLFSATLTERVKKMAYRNLNSPLEVEIKSEYITGDDVKETLFHVHSTEKFNILMGLLKNSNKKQSCIIFTNTKHTVERIAKKLLLNGISCDYIMGDLPQAKRTVVVQNMKQGKTQVLVATDVAARGLHIDDLDLVINYDLPEDPQGYVHRIGRTGRAGKQGKAISLACERYVFYLESIEGVIGYKIPITDFEEYKDFINIHDVTEKMSFSEINIKARYLLSKQIRMRGSKRREEKKPSLQKERDATKSATPSHVKRKTHNMVMSSVNNTKKGIFKKIIGIATRLLHLKTSKVSDNKPYSDSMELHKKKKNNGQYAHRTLSHTRHKKSGTKRWRSTGNKNNTTRTFTKRRNN